MKSIHHSHWHTSVDRLGAESLDARAAFISTGLECAAGLRVNKFSFKIEKARWEVFRSPAGPLSADITGLVGVEAYLGSGGDLRRVMLKDYGEMALSLISEAVRGVIQAETFLYRERGYQDGKSYDDFWNSMYLNTCRYYSNLDRITVPWESHVAGQQRYGCLFNRFKTISLARDGEELLATGSLADSFHEVGLRLTLDRSSSVTSARLSLLRGPDPVCFESDRFSPNLQGLKLPALSKKDLAAALGGSQGCVHMIDLCHDLATVLRDLP